VHQAGASLAGLGVGMLGERPAGSENGRLMPGPPKGLLPPLLLLVMPLEGPKMGTGVLSAARRGAPSRGEGLHVKRKLAAALGWHWAAAVARLPIKAPPTHAAETHHTPRQLAQPRALCSHLLPRS
jgi:hypothetical protein